MVEVQIYEMDELPAPLESFSIFWLTWLHHIQVLANITIETIGKNDIRSVM
jgi:hypothetical protein